jgi:hypothetical protein
MKRLPCELASRYRMCRRPQSAPPRPAGQSVRVCIVCHCAVRWTSIPRVMCNTIVRASCVLTVDTNNSECTMQSYAPPLLRGDSAESGSASRGGTDAGSVEGALTVSSSATTPGATLGRPLPWRDNGLLQPSRAAAGGGPGDLEAAQSLLASPAVASRAWMEEHQEEVRRQQDSQGK